MMYVFMSSAVLYVAPHLILAGGVPVQEGEEAERVRVPDDDEVSSPVSQVG